MRDNVSAIVDVVQLEEHGSRLNIADRGGVLYVFFFRNPAGVDGQRFVDPLPRRRRVL